MTFEPTQQQREVIGVLDGDLFVNAGAGSGKTRVLAERFAAAILGGDGRPGASVDALLGITYTEKAAGELGERIRRVFLERGATGPAREIDRAWLSTIHGFCSRVLRRHPLEAGVDPLFSVADEVASSILRREAFETAARGAMAADGGVERLILDYGAEAVRAGVMAVLADLRAMGARLCDLRTEQEAGVADAMSEAAAEAESFAATIASAATCDSDAANVESLRTLAGLLRSAASEALDPDRVETLMRTIERFKLAGGGRGEERRVAKASALELRDAVVSQLAGVVAGRYVPAFLRLLEGCDIAYAAAKAARGLLDFEDLQLTTAELFERHPEVAAGYRERFAMVMVDEFQDTNALQTRIVEAIADGDLCVVGDDKQSIYGFRHADVDVFRERARVVAEAGGVSRSLSVNFRSHQGILDFVNAAFSRPPFFSDGFLELTGARTGGWKAGLTEDASRVEVMLVERDGWQGRGWREAEAAYLAARLRRLHDSGVAPRHMVVLLRSLGCADTYADALRAEGLPVFVAAGGAYFGRPEVAQVRALLGVIVNPRDDEAAATLLAGPIARLSDGGLWRLANAAGRGRFLWDALVDAEAAGLADGDLEAARSLSAVMERLRRSQGAVPLADTVLEGCRALGYEKALCARGPDGRRGWANVRKIARLADEFESAAPGDAGSFLEYLALREEHQRYEPLAEVASEETDAVRILTTHSAKGLEFPVVAVADLGHGLGGTGAREAFLLGRGPVPALALRLPKPGDGDGEAVPTAAYVEAEREAAERSAAEEKRVLYVACTRAEELLILSGGSRLGKPAEAGLPIGWLRESLGFGGEGSAATGTTTLGEASAAVTVVTPESGVPEPAREKAVCEDATPAEAASCAVAPPPAPASGVPPTVSYSSLRVFEECPRRFFAEYVARLGQVREESPATRLGTAVHAALQLTGDGRLSAARSASLVTFHRLDAAARGRFDRALGVWARSALCTRVAASDRVAREVPFALPLGDSMLVGNMDVLAWEDRRALVVDFKTGSGEGGDSDGARRTQAECYALAALAGGARSVEVAFIELECEGEVTSFEFAAADRDRVSTRLGGLVERMRAGDMHARERWTAEPCRRCPAAPAMCSFTRPDTAV